MLQALMEELRATDRKTQDLSAFSAFLHFFRLLLFLDDTVFFLMLMTTSLSSLLLDRPITVYLNGQG